MAGTISSAGVGSGLDVSSIITKLLAAEQAPLKKLQTAATTMQTQLSAFGQLQSLMSGFRDAVAPLYAADNYALTSATSSDASAVGATSSTKSAPGSYAISVSKLAAFQTVVGQPGQFATSADKVGTGSITLRLGAWNADQTGFMPKTGSEDIVIPIGASESTLAGIRDKINAANAGVSASIITDANGARLSFSSTTTGADNGFRITVNDDGGNGAGLTRVAFDPPSAAGGMALTQAASNTEATINGIAVTTTGNTLADVVEGMTFTLSKVTTSPVTVNVARNTDPLRAILSGVVGAYNALNTFLDQTTKYDAATKSGALLQGDSTAVGIQNQLRAAIGQNGSASSVFSTLSSVGIEFQKDGSLKLNDTKVAAALNNLPELQKSLGTWVPSNPAANGFGKKLASLADGLLSIDGTLPGKNKSIQAKIAANQKDQERANERLAAIERRLRAQYSALDNTMSKANALSQYVSQQITTWNNIKTNG